MRIDYDKSLSHFEHEKLSSFQRIFLKYLRHPCGINISVKWSARQLGAHVRNIELRTVNENYLLHAFEAAQLNEISEIWIKREAEYSISIRWPKEEKFFDELYRPIQTHLYVVYRMVEYCDPWDESTDKQEEEFSEFMVNLGAVENQSGCWAFESAIPEHFPRLYAEFANNHLQLIAAGISWRTYKRDTIYGFVPLNPTEANPLLDLPKNPAPAVSNLIERVKLFLDEASHRISRERMLKSRSEKKTIG